MRQLLAIASDLQCGGTTAICPPKVELDDGGMYQASPLQKKVFNYWKRSWKKVQEIKGDDEMIFTFLGEPGDGDHHRSYQLWSTRLFDQAKAALDCLNIPSQMASKVYCVRGTPVHSDNKYDIDDVVAKELGAHKLRSHFSLELTLQGKRFFFCHQGPSPGARDWTWGDTIRRELKDQFYRSIKRGRKPPDYFVWAHYHQKAYEPFHVDYKNKEFVMRGYIIPGWQLSTAYISRLKKGEEIMQIGLLYFIIENGEVSHHWIVDERDVTERVKL